MAVKKEEKQQEVNENLIWIDLEMTGLLPNEDTIIEIATIVTDKDLNVLAEGPVFAIHQSDETLNKMDEWNTNQHGKSGLIKRVQQSKITAHIAEQKTIEFLKQYIEKGISPMCGNTICQDRRFLVNEMPQLEKYFHYRHIDVSTIKELIKRWKPEAKRPKKESEHLALADIHDSINELKHYREHFIKS